MTSKRLLSPAQMVGLGAMLVTLMGLALLAWRGAALREETLLRGEFERRCDQIYLGLTGRLETLQALLRAGAGYWGEHPQSGIMEWHSIVQASQVLTRYPGVDGVAFSQAVPPGGTEAFTADIRKRLWRNFTIQPAPAPDTAHMVMTYFEPLERAHRLLGFDMASEPLRRKAAELARDTGLSTLSAPLNLLGGEDGSVRAVLLLQPIYRSDFPVETTEQRRRAILGWLIIGLQANKLFDALLAESNDPLLDIHVLAGGLGASNLVYGDGLTPPGTVFSSSRSLEFGGQRWVLNLHRHLPGGSIWLSATPLVVLISSLGLGLALTVAAGLMLVSREQSRRLARHAMTELTRTEKMLAAVTASVPGVIYRWLEGPAASGFRFVAPQAAVMFGTAPAALVEDWRRLPFLPADLENWQQSLRTAARSALPWEAEGRYQDTEGTIRWWRATATPSTGPEGVLFDGVIVDITELKEAEQILVERERSYREMFERSSAVMVLIDPLATRIVDANPAALTYYGYAEDDIRGMDATHISLLDQDGWRQLCEATLRGETEFYRSRHRLASGEVREVEVHAGPVNVGGRTYIHAIVHDVTDRERFQAELKIESAKLAATNAELEQFSYVASHDLQEPLRTIASFLQLLERRYADKLDGEAHEFIDFAVDAATRLQSMIRDLLDYSRVGTRGGAFIDTDMNEQLAVVRANLGRAINEAGAVVEGEALPVVQADRVQMQSLLQNLIGNALKYRRPDVAPHIRISAEEEANAWVFRIADNGIGIEPQYFDRIFQVFQRLHTREKFSGTGIGLALCRKIVERHGGTIWVESRPGEGTTFLFRLPKRPNSPTAPR